MVEGKELEDQVSAQETEEFKVCTLCPWGGFHLNIKSCSERFLRFLYHLFLSSKFGAKYFVQQLQNSCTPFLVLLFSCPGLTLCSGSSKGG